MKGNLENFIDKMQKENLDDIVLKSFSYYFQKVQKGETGELSEDSIRPPQSVNITKYEDLKDKSNKYLKDLVVIKLNGGLGTSMGLKKAKSLLKVKEEKSFLDIIAQQIIRLREKSGTKIPLMLMDSFNTRKDSLELLSKYEDLKIDDLPLDFLQNKYPKIVRSDLSPLHKENDKLNWNPPGHGEIYTAMKISGTLEKLLNNGYKYAFISNSDNLGAIVDKQILNYFANLEIPFLMEVCKRTEMDKKGGHLAETKEGQLILREVAQCPEEDIEEFQNINKYKYFNTNNLWINLEKLQKKLETNNNFLPLPLIVNKKEVEGEKVYQLETAMGAAISIFENSKALVIPRSRFLPVKKTNDLLRIWSDAYKINADKEIVKTSNFTPHIDLDERYYKNIEQLKSHCKDGIPSLQNCSYLKIIGDVYFGENVVIEGDVTIEAAKKVKIEEKKIKDEKIKF